MRNISFLICIMIMISGCASALAPKPIASTQALKAGGYVLDQSHASLVFKIDHLGFSNYVGRFEKFNASLDFNEGSPADAKVEAVIDIASLDIANDDFAQTLIGPQWFDADAFPQARFKSSRIEITGENTGRMIGDFTLKGVTEEIVLAVTFNGGDRDLLRGAYVIGFSANGSFDRTLFGVDRFAGIIGNEVTIEIEAEFTRSN